MKLWEDRPPLIYHKEIRIGGSTLGQYPIQFNLITKFWCSAQQCLDLIQLDMFNLGICYGTSSVWGFGILWDPQPCHVPPVCQDL